MENPSVQSGPVMNPKISSPSISGQDFKKLVEAGMEWLRTNQQTVNSLNVFPVPDGDTGTNMLLTMQAAYAEIASSGESNIGKIAHKVAQGALMGARGNSGVILSQLWRGFARALDNLESMDAVLLAKALTEAKLTAYKGVVRPVEGTILTVAKDLAACAESTITTTTDLDKVLEAIVAASDESVKHTPELLPILKQAGVVDSGGKGLYYILEGMLRYIKGLPLDVQMSGIQPLAALGKLDETIQDIEEGQDFEVVIDFKPYEDLDVEKFYTDLTEIGTSIQLGEGDGMYRLHIHVPEENLHEPVKFIRSIGTFIKETTENLRTQIEEVEKVQKSRINLTPVQPGKIAVVAVSPGIGISRIFASLGVNAVVEGGQTMNPSTEEILSSFENLPTDKVIILPNNKNIILAAQTASTVTVKKVKVIPCRSVPQGLSAILRYDPEGDLESVSDEMMDAIKDVETGEITTATRSVEINGVQVSEGQVIALHNGTLVAASESLEEACFKLLSAAKTEDRERITLIYGSNISRQEVDQIADKIRKIYRSHEIEIHEGGQPYYQFIISIE